MKYVKNNQNIQLQTKTVNQLYLKKLKEFLIMNFFAYF